MVTNFYVLFWDTKTIRAIKTNTSLDNLSYGRRHILLQKHYMSKNQNPITDNCSRRILHPPYNTITLLQLSRRKPALTWLERDGNLIYKVNMCLSR